jgi:phage/plasmid-like protein (TIGR03299 family)
MAHELTMTNGKAEMAFIGETPWHGLGQELQEGASIEQWQASAGMDWRIESSPVMFNTIGSEYNVFTGQNVLYRSDNRDALSVVSNRYKAVQPKEVLEFFRDLVAENGFKINTAGTLRGGRRMWALAETGKFGEVCKNDEVGGYLLLSTSCDRTLATTARFTTVRVVCNNTLSMAHNEKQNAVSFSHIQHFDHQVVKEKLGNAVGAFGAFMDMAKFLQTQQMNSQASETFLKSLLANVTQIKDEEYDLSKNRAYKKIISLFDCEAKGLSLVGHTKWGMLNAVTEYYDHHAPSRSNDARLDNSWFGTGEAVKNKAVQLLTA